MKSLKESINEAKNCILNCDINFDLRSDIYSVLSDLAFEYDKRNKKFDKNKVEEAIEWFLDQFYEQNPDFD